MAPTVGMVRMVGSAYPKDRGWSGASGCPGPGHVQVNRRSHPLNDLFQHLGYSKLNQRNLNELSITFSMLSIEWEYLL